MTAPRWLLLLGVVGALVLVVSLVEHDAGRTTVTVAPAEAPPTEAELAGRLGLVEVDGASWASPRGCDVAAVLVTQGAVDLYREAGDPVVEGPHGTGVKLGTDTPACRGELAALLAEAG